MMTIYYDPYALYDLELSLFSLKFEQLSPTKVDMTLYKGAKNLFLEVDPGAYEVKISMKHPGTIDEEISIASVEFQLSIIYAETISRQHVLPHSLNYLGYRD